MCPEMHPLEKRLIEAGVVVPLITEVAQRLGWEETRSILQEVNQREAFQRGRNLAIDLGRNGIEELVDVVAAWGRDCAWQMDVLEKTGTTYFFNVTKCPYHEKYKELGVEEFGMEFSCCREKYFAKGFNPDLRLVRKKTIMGGADHCDFRYYLKG